MTADMASLMAPPPQMANPPPGGSAPATKGTGEGRTFATVVARLLAGATSGEEGTSKTAGKTDGATPEGNLVLLLQALLRQASQGTVPADVTGTPRLDRPAGAETKQTGFEEAYEALMVQLRLLLATEPAAVLPDAATDVSLTSGSRAPGGVPWAGSGQASPGQLMLLARAALSALPARPAVTASTAAAQPATAATALPAGAAATPAATLPQPPMYAATMPSTSRVGLPGDAPAEASTTRAGGELPGAAARLLAAMQAATGAGSGQAADAGTGDLPGSPQALADAAQPSTGLDGPPPVPFDATPRIAATPLGVEVVDAAEPARMVFQLADSVQSAVMRGDHEVRLVLNPPDLGHLDVRIAETASGLRVVLEAANADAHDLIERQLPALHSALEARDLRVDRLQVGQAGLGLSTDTSAQQSGTGAQDGSMPWRQGGDADGDVPWSPVAALRRDGGNEPPRRTAARGTGLVDVMA